MSNTSVSLAPRLRVSKDASVTVKSASIQDAPSVLSPGIYKTTYGTLANVVNPYIIWDIIYRQDVGKEYLLPFRVRKASYKEFPEYYRDRGRDEVVVRNVWRDSTGKRRVRKV